MRIYGIDPSLKSTGLCILDVDFKESASNILLKILTTLDPQLTPDEIDCFKSSVSISYLDQISVPKTIEKELAKTRKIIRESINVGLPSSCNLRRVEELLTERIKYQTDNIVRVHSQFNPDIICMEDYSYNSQGSLIQLAEMKGYFRAVRTFPVYTAPIPSVKKVASTKGNANKALIYKNISRYPFDRVFDEKRDDEIDALAITLTTYYSIYHHLHGFAFEKSKNSKEKAQQKSWIKCLETCMNHLGFEGMK